MLDMMTIGKHPTDVVNEDWVEEEKEYALLIHLYTLSFLINYTYTHFT